MYKIEGTNLIVTIPLNAEPTVSNSEAAKAAKENRAPVARAMGGTGGFVAVGKFGKHNLCVSANVICR